MEKKHNWVIWIEAKKQTFRKTLLEMLKLGGSGSGKKKSFFNLISHQPDIDKIYLYVKDPYEAKY